MSVIRVPELEEVASILAYGKDLISMITLAPEICTPEMIKLIQDAGIVVSAGHTNATYETAMQFFDAGIPVATHLFNAMSAFQHRAPGVVGALFDHPTAMSSVIADGYHVDYAAIRVAKKIMGDRLFCITDAVTETSTGLYQHTLVGDKYESAGTLSGSALTQLKSIQNMVEHVGIPFGEAIRMCSLYPAKVMKNKKIPGTIEVNTKANLLCLNSDFRILNSAISH